MRPKCFWLGSIISFFLFGAAFAQSPDADWPTCENVTHPEASIRSCTAIIVAARMNTVHIAVIYHLRGISYAILKNYDQALDDFDQAIRLNPREAIPFINRGEAYYNKQDYDHAIADYDQSIKLVANNAIGFRARGHAYRAKKDYDHAIADYDQAIRLAPNYAVAFNERGNVYRDKQDFDRAMADYDRAIKLNPKEASFFSDRGLCYFQQGRFTEAESDFEQAVKLKPEESLAMLSRNFLQAKMDRADLSGPSSRLAAAKWPGTLIGLYSLRMTPEEVQAAAAMGDTNTRQMQLCKTAFYVGEYQSLRGDKAAARSLWQQAVDICPHEMGEYLAAGAELKPTP